MEQKTIPEDLKVNDIDDLAVYFDFVKESQEHLETIEIKTLELEKNPTDTLLLDDIFRPMHTIKGVAGFLSLKHVNRLTHDAETLLDHARNGRIVIERECVKLLLDVVMCLRELIHVIEWQLDGNSLDGVAYPSVESLIERIGCTIKTKTVKREGFDSQDDLF